VEEENSSTLGLAIEQRVETEQGGKAQAACCLFHKIKMPFLTLHFGRVESKLLETMISSTQRKRGFSTFWGVACCFFRSLASEGLPLQAATTQEFSWKSFSLERILESSSKQAANIK